MAHVILCSSYHHYIVKYKMRFWNCLKCGREESSMLLSRYLQERRLFSVDTLRVEVSRKEICQNSVFSEVTLRLRNFGIFCRADTSLSLVSPCLVAS